MRQFYIRNGELETVDTLSSYDPFCDNECIHQSIRLYDTVALFLSEQIQNIRKTATYLNIPIPQRFTTERIERYIYKLLNVNKVYKNGICDIYIFTTLQQEAITEFAIRIQKIESVAFPFNIHGRILGMNPDIIIPKPYIPCQYSRHNYIQTLLRNHKIENTDISCIYNDNGDIIHVSEGNLIYNHDSHIHVCSNIYTEPVTLAFLDYLATRNYSIIVHDFFTNEEILNCKELMIIGQFIGIQWICRITDKRQKSISIGYTNAKKLSDLFNQFIHTTTKKK